MKSERILRMTPSATIELEGTVADLHAQGIDVIGLNAGEPDFNTPVNIIMACTRAMEEGKTKYCKVSGIPELRQAICDKLFQDTASPTTPIRFPFPPEPNRRCSMRFWRWSIRGTR